MRLGAWHVTGIIVLVLALSHSPGLAATPTETALPDVIGADQTFDDNTVASVAGSQTVTVKAAGTPDSLPVGIEFNQGSSLRNEGTVMLESGGGITMNKGSAYQSRGAIVVGDTAAAAPGNPKYALLDNASRILPEVIIRGDLSACGADDAGIGLANLFADTALNSGGGIRLGGDTFTRELALNPSGNGGYVIVDQSSVFEKNLDVGISSLSVMSADRGQDADYTVEMRGEVKAGRLAVEGHAVDFRGKVTAADHLSVESGTDSPADNVVTFHDDVETAFLEIYANPADSQNAPQTFTANFNGNVNLATGGFMAMQLPDKDYAGTDGNNYAAVILGGNVNFGGAVATNDQNFLVAGGAASFAGSLDAGGGQIQIGLERLLDDENGDEAYAEYNFAHTNTADNAWTGDTRGAMRAKLAANGAGVQLRENASFKAAEIYAGAHATVSLDGDASFVAAKTLFDGGSVVNPGLNTLRIDGDAEFRVGSTYAATLGADKSSRIDVTRNVSIHDGALVTVGGLTPEEAADTVILTAGGTLDGMFTNTVYNLRRTADGKGIEVASMRETGAIIPGGILAGQNARNASQLYERVVNDVNVSADVRRNMAAGLEQATLLHQADPALGKVAVDQVLAGYASRAGEAARVNANRFNSGVGSRIAYVHDSAFAAGGGLGSGSAYASPYDGGGDFYEDEGIDRIWLGDFGAWSGQDDRGGEYGYQYDGHGIIMGYDWELGPITAGFSGAFSAGEMKNNEGYTRTDVEIMNVGMYASYDPGSGLFADTNIGYGHSWNKTRTALVTGGSKSGRYSNYSLQAGANVGYVFDGFEGFRVTPTLGLQYTRVHQNGWDESASSPGLIANWFEDSSASYLEVPLAVRVSRTFEFANGMSLTPEARAAWIYDAKDSRAMVRMGYAGSSDTTALYGVDPGRSHGLIGGGLKANFNPNLDAFVDYNYEFRSGFHNSNLTTGLGMSF